MNEADELSTCITCGKPSKLDPEKRPYGLCPTHYRNAHDVLYVKTGTGNGQHHLTQEHSINIR